MKIEDVKKKVSPTFCILPWIHLSTRPNGHMRLCCTANASSAGATNDKKYGGEVGILKNDDGKPANLNHTDLLTGWNNSYMKDVRKKMLNGEIPAACTKCFKEEEVGHARPVARGDRVPAPVVAHEREIAVFEQLVEPDPAEVLEVDRAPEQVVGPAVDDHRGQKPPGAIGEPGWRQIREGTQRAQLD